MDVIRVAHSGLPRRLRASSTGIVAAVFLVGDVLFEPPIAIVAAVAVGLDGSRHVYLLPKSRSRRPSIRVLEQPSPRRALRGRRRRGGRRDRWCFRSDLDVQAPGHARRILVVADLEDMAAGQTYWDRLAPRRADAERSGRCPGVQPLADRLADERRGRCTGRGRRTSHRVAEAIPAEHVDASVGDPDPLQAIDDSVRLFAPDDVILVTRADDDASWLEVEPISPGTLRCSDHAPRGRLITSWSTDIDAPPALPAERPRSSSPVMIDRCVDARSWSRA